MSDSKNNNIPRAKLVIITGASSGFGKACASMPAHININRSEIIPTCQSFAPLTISRSES